MLERLSAAPANHSKINFTNMFSHLSFFPRLGGAAALLVLAALPAYSQVTVVDWVGVDSNYLNSANWSTGVVPDGTSDLRLTSTPTNRVINLSNTGTGDVTYQVNALRTGVQYGYTINLSGNANGKLIYNIVGRGTHPYNTEPLTTGTGNTANRLSMYMNVGPNTVITFDGSTTLASGSTSGLTYATINLTGNSMIDGSNIGGSLLEIGMVNVEQGSSVYLGSKKFTVSGNVAAGLEEQWAGHVYQDVNATTRGYDTQKWGTGTTRVMPTGVVDIPGNFRIRGASQYLVDGVHNGVILTAGTGGVVGGTGTINGPSVTDSSVTVRPTSAVQISVNNSLAPAGRDDVGTLTINGHVTQNGTLSFEMFTPTAYDKLLLHGDLMLGATSTLAVGLADSFPLQPGTYRLLTVSGTNYDVDAGAFVANAIEGTFGSVALPSSQGLAASYVMTSTYIDVIFKQLAFATNPQLSGNQKRIAFQVDRAVAADTAPLSLLDTLNRAPSIILFREILDQLSPTAYQSWFPSAVTRANSMVQTIDDQMFQSIAGDRAAGSMETFFQGYRQESSRDADDISAYSNYDTMSALGGFDYAIGAGTVLGGFVSYDTTDYDLDVYSGTSTVESTTVGAYLRNRRGPVELTGTAFVGVDDYESRRSIVRTKLGDWADSTTDGLHFGGKVGAGYLINTPWFEITPTAALQYLSWETKAFTESGSNGGNLRVKYQRDESIASRAGFRLSRSFEVAHGILRPFFNVAWQHEFKSGERELKADLFGSQVTVAAPGIDSNGFRIDAGIDWNVSRAISLNARYITEQGGAADESVGVRGGLTIAF